MELMGPFLRNLYQRRPELYEFESEMPNFV